MLARSVSNFLTRRPVKCQTKLGCKALALQHTRGQCGTSTQHLDQVRTLLQLFVDRYYVSPGQTNVELFKRGVSCSYGPLGTELRRNVLDQWWHSVTRSRAQVFGINTLSSSQDGEGGHLRIAEYTNIKQMLDQRQLSEDQLTQEVHMLLQRSPSVRTNLLQGTLLHTPVPCCPPETLGNDRRYVLEVLTIQDCQLWKNPV